MVNATEITMELIRQGKSMSEITQILNTLARTEERLEAVIEHHTVLGNQDGKTPDLR